jgi:SRSO17 transposase
MMVAGGATMTQRRPVSPAPGPLEAYAQCFDNVFTKHNQRDSVRRYLEGLLLPSERTKTLTALANTEPVAGAQQPAAQKLQWFLSESTWDVAAVTQRRIEVLRSDPSTAPSEDGVLVVDETGDRKDGTQTAHVGRQYLANLGKIDNGVVSVSTLWADARVYYPLEVEPYTPAHYFEQGKSDPAFRTKPAIALALTERAVAASIPFRAVVADSFYGEHAGFISGLERLGAGYVVGLKPSHAWWHQADTPGSLSEAATEAAAEKPGAWEPIERTFQDGHTELWHALEVLAGPYGPDKPRRAVIVTTDPGTLPGHATWYLATNLPALATTQATDGLLTPAGLAEIVRLYGLRMWVEQSYKQVKHRLGWSQYQVRSGRAIRRHWELVCCAFCFCWWAHGMDLLAAAPWPLQQTDPTADTPVVRKKNPAQRVLAGGAAPSAQLVAAMGAAHALVASLDGSAPAARAAGVAGLAVERARHSLL